MSAPQSIVLQAQGYKYDSPKPPTSLTITASVSGSMSAADAGTGLTNTVTFAATTRTKILTRKTFIPRAYYHASVLPGTDEFYLVADCCCAKCRWDIGDAGPGGGLSPDGMLFPWDSTWAGPGAPGASNGDDSPVILANTGYLDATIPAGGEGYEAQRAALRLRFCRANDEDGRIGQPMGLIITDAFTRPANGFTMPPLSWSYTDSSTSATGAAYAGDLALPGPASAEDRIEADSCADTLSVDSEIIYSGSAVVGAITSTVSAFTLGMTFDLT